MIRLNENNFKREMYRLQSNNMISFAQFCYDNRDIYCTHAEVCLATGLARTTSHNCMSNLSRDYGFVFERQGNSFRLSRVKDTPKNPKKKPSSKAHDFGYLVTPKLQQLNAIFN